VHFALLDEAGRLLLERRPESGLLGGMLALPGTPWRAEPWTDAEALAHAPRTGLDWQARPGVAQHGFTHRDLTMRVMTARVPELPEGVPLDQAARSLPSAMKKLLPLL
jgi:A/G-specific adenine glycosylase